MEFGFDRDELQIPCFIGLFAVVLFILAFLLTVRKRTRVEAGGEGTAKAVKRFFAEAGPPMAACFFGFGVPWGIIVALWGLKAGLGLSAIFALAGLSTLVFGGFGGEWVGPNAHQMKQKDADAAPILLFGGIVWATISGILLLFFSFDGWLPWPAR
jgi:hypothetical protein